MKKSFLIIVFVFLFVSPLLSFEILTDENPSDRFSGFYLMISRNLLISMAYDSEDMFAQDKFYGGMKEIDEIFYYDFEGDGLGNRLNFNEEFQNYFLYNHSTGKSEMNPDIPYENTLSISEFIRHSESWVSSYPSNFKFYLFDIDGENTLLVQYEDNDLFGLNMRMTLDLLIREDFYEWHKDINSLSAIDKFLSGKWIEEKSYHFFLNDKNQESWEELQSSIELERTAYNRISEVDNKLLNHYDYSLQQIEEGYFILLKQDNSLKKQYVIIPLSDSEFILVEGYFVGENWYDDFYIRYFKSDE